MAEKYEVSNKELHQLQRICLEMLLEVDRICRKHDIQYSVDGGSLLGAVRHQGFIPWDDDVDIIFRRAEYEKFRKACESELDTDRFFLQDYTTDPEYRWGYAKLRRNNTVQVRLGQEMIKQNTGVFCDIFVVDNVPDSIFLRKLHYGICYSIRKIQYSPVGSVMAPNALLRGWYKVLSVIPRNATFAVRNWLAKISNKKRTELISHYTYHYYKRCKYGLPAECFDSFIDLDFEGYKVRAFEKYDLYLSKLYGDYMTLPPEDKRVSDVYYSDLKLIDVDVKLREDEK